MAKAANGTVTRRGKRFRARIKFFRHEWTESFDTRAQALDWLAHMRRRHHEDRLRGGLDAGRLTLGVALQRYAEEIAPRQKDERAIGRIQRLIRDEPGLCALPISRIMPADIADFVERRLAGGCRRAGRKAKAVTPATVNHDLAVISVIFNTARARWGYGTLQNPVGKGMRLKGDNARSRRISLEELETLFKAGLDYERDHNAGVPVRVLIALAVLTAMRQSELVKMDWRDIDLEQGTILLQHTKNGRPRLVPLRIEAERILRLLGPKREGRVFPNLTGAALRQAFQRVCERAGIEDLRYHDLRHEGTSRYFEDAEKFGLSDQEIAQITGHRTWSMLSRYTHLRARSIAAKLRGGARHVERPELPLDRYVALPASAVERRSADGTFRRLPAE